MPQDINKANRSVARVFELYETAGHHEYGERVTMLMHMVQAALIAERAGYNDEMVLAAFLHDIGHFFEQEEKMGIYGTRQHDEIGGTFLLELGFPPIMAQLVASHVQAKRYLTYADPGYYQSLSEASRITLQFQGGPMTVAEAVAFMKDEHFDAYILIRQWDDLGKDADCPVAVEDLTRLRKKMLQYLLVNGL